MISASLGLGNFVIGNQVSYLPVVFMCKFLLISWGGVDLERRTFGTVVGRSYFSKLWALV